VKLRTALVSLALVSALALAACGGESESEEAAEQNATPAQARAEIVEVRNALDTAVAELKEGDAKAADNTVSEGYLEHFEKVEGPLEKVDGQLNEKLEDSIREELREKIQDGGSLAEVTQMVNAIKADLATAEQKLQ
jgi:ABC-type enterochelin transport system substrate-binding protein